MLIRCPECELQVSDKASVCPHCGYPLQPNQGITRKPRNVSNKRKRLPNGFGQISEIKDRKLRKPFRVMVTVGKTSTGRPICKPLKPDAYFATYNEAYAALVEYNKNPYDLEPAITVKELYDRWSSEYFKTLKSASSQRTITSSWAYCSSLYNMRACDLRARHIKQCMEHGTVNIKGEERTPTANMKSRIKSMFNLMLDYALEYEIVDRNYARTFNISDDIVQEKEKTRRGHIPFTEDEMKKLWKNIDRVPYVDVILIQCYTGFRPQELGLIELKNIDLEQGYIIGGMKTKAGTDRYVPIHPKIYSLVVKRYEEAMQLNSKYLINCTDTSTHRSSNFLTYDKYQNRFKNILDNLGLNREHKAHDGRMHFITTAKKYGVDEYAIKRIVGHSISDITEKIYTQREKNWLKDELEKIK